jgi:quaternary ammonium compound-resistance protein SugE
VRSGALIAVDRSQFVQPRRAGVIQNIVGWIYLVIAGILETAWAVGLRYSEGFTRLWPSLWTIATMAGSIYLLALAVRTLPLGTAYAVWTGIGAVGAVAYSIAFFGEPATAARLGCIALIVAGILGLKFVS